MLLKCHRSRQYQCNNSTIVHCVLLKSGGMTPRRFSSNSISTINLFNSPIKYGIIAQTIIINTARYLGASPCDFSNEFDENCCVKVKLRERDKLLIRCEFVDLWRFQLA